MNSVSEMTVQRLLLELETGGNVRFEDGKPSDPWYKSCHDLVLSRFCVGDYQVHSFSFRLESALSGSLSDDDGDGNENGKKRNRFNKENNNLYFLLLQDFVVKRPNVAFCESPSSFEKDTMSGNSGGIYFSGFFTLLEKEIIHWKQQLVVDCLRHPRSCK